MWSDRAQQMNQAIAQYNQQQQALATMMARLEDQLGAIVEDMTATPGGGCPPWSWRSTRRRPRRRAGWPPGPTVLPARKTGSGGTRETRTAWAEVVDIEKRADWERLPDVPGVPDVALFIEPIPPPPVGGVGPGQGGRRLPGADRPAAPRRPGADRRPQRPDLGDRQRSAGRRPGLRCRLDRRPVPPRGALREGPAADDPGPGRCWRSASSRGSGSGPPSGGRRQGCLPGDAGDRHPPPTMPPGMTHTGYDTLPRELTGAPGPIPNPPHRPIPNYWPESPVPSPQLPSAAPAAFGAGEPKLASVHPWMQQGGAGL